VSDAFVSCVKGIRVLLGFRKCEQAASIRSQYGISKFIGHSFEFDVSVMGDIFTLFVKTAFLLVRISARGMVLMAIVMMITIIVVAIIIIIIIIIIMI
jgi:hypothetical protein